MNYYKMLGVSPKATIQEIKVSFRNLAKKHHPDKNPNSVEQSTKFFAELLNAYDTLVDPNKRVLYDKKWSAQKPERKPPSPPSPIKRPKLNEEMLQSMMEDLGLPATKILHIWNNDPNLGKIWSAPAPTKDIWGEPIGKKPTKFIDPYGML